MTQPAHDSHVDSHPDPGHETSDVRPSLIGRFGAGLVAMVALVMPLLGWMYSTMESRIQRNRQEVSALTPDVTYSGPQLQPQPSVELRDLKNAELKHLTSYGWIDREKGVVHVPVEAAIKLLATQGLPEPEGPARPTAKEEPRP
ncbi:MULTISPECIES: hypothetical protein [unclassified Schlesneria]|uniref:hypothetical protein n=1 Tax=Schlesneria TaxID=656899 RepID=UPI002F016900